MLMSNEVDFRGEKIIRDKEGHYILIKKCTDSRNEELQNI